MKLSVWAKKQGISYITAWRWFNEGRLPVKAYRSDSGTIIVQDESESSEQVMGNNQSNDVMSMVLKKTVEFSKNNGTIEDFAAWVLSNFSLRVNTGSDSPKYSRVKPKAEDIQKHFQQFMKKGEKPKPHAFVATEDALDEIVRGDGLADDARLSATLEAGDDTSFCEPTNIVNTTELTGSLAELFVSPNTSVYNNSATHASVGGVVTRSVDSTPQLNYTGSTNAALDSNFSSSNGWVSDTSQQPQYVATANVLSKQAVSIPNNSFYFSRTEEPLDVDGYKVIAPERARRGRKPAKSFRK